jgi:hypothetical protein
MFVKGKSGNPLGRPPSSINRVQAVLDAISKRVKQDGYPGVVTWLSNLPDETLAQLYGKIIPRDTNLHAMVTMSFEDCLRRMEPQEPESDENSENSESTLPQD